MKIKYYNKLVFPKNKRNKLYFTNLCFNEGFARVQLRDGTWTFVDTNGKLWKQHFKNCGDFGEFNEDLAWVQLKNGDYTFVNKNGNVWEQRFNRCTICKKGLAYVQLKDDSNVYVDEMGNFQTDCNEIHHDGHINSDNNILTEIEETDTPTENKQNNILAENNHSNTTDIKKATGLLKQMQADNITEGLENYEKILDEISKNPSKFLDLPSEAFKDEKFIETCILKIRTALKEGVNTADNLDEYAEYCNQLLDSVKEIVKRKRTSLIHEDIETKKHKLLKKIDDFTV